MFCLSELFLLVREEIRTRPWFLSAALIWFGLTLDSGFVLILALALNLGVGALDSFATHPVRGIITLAFVLFLHGAAGALLLHKNSLCLWLWQYSKKIFTATGKTLLLKRTPRTTQLPRLEYRRGAELPPGDF